MIIMIRRGNISFYLWIADEFGYHPFTELDTEEPIQYVSFVCFCFDFFRLLMKYSIFFIRIESQPSDQPPILIYNSAIARQFHC